MLTRFNALQNVGRFRDIAHAKSPDSTFKRLTLLFARNGAGKSTLAAVLNACGCADPSAMAARQKLGAAGAPMVALVCGGHTVRFDGAVWHGACSRCFVYDRDFIEKNVYLGRSIRKDQRAGLLQLALGATEVDAAKTMERIGAETQRLNSRKRELEGALGAVVAQSGLSLAAFRQLPIVENVVEGIAAAERRAADAQIADEIRRRPRLSAVPEPPRVLKAELTALLATATRQISEDARAAVDAHMGKRLGGKGERWVHEGLQLVDGKTCPFCGQDAVDVRLLDYFVEYFDRSYDALRSRVTAQRGALAGFDSWWNEVTTRGRENVRALAAWPELFQAGEVSFNSAERREQLTRFRSLVDGLLVRKLERLPGVIVEDAAVDAAFEGFDELRRHVVNYNLSVEVANQRIVAKLHDVGVDTAVKAHAELQHLRACALRHSVDVVKLVSQIEGIEQERRRLEEEKAHARGELERVQGRRLEGFVGEINSLLAEMGTNIRISDASSEMSGGRPAASFSLIIDGEPLVLGKGKKGEESFSLVLSDGDRSALAFAVFVAAARWYSDLDQRVLVFDDPMTSLDQERLYSTVDVLAELSKKAKQLIVMSHDPRFLLALSLRASIPSDQRAEVELCRSGKALKPWNAEEYCANQYLRLRTRMNRFVDDESLDEQAESVRGDIRKVLEDYLRFRWPEHFALSGTLEHYVRILRSGALQGVAQYSDENIDQLDRICKFSQGQHHGEGGRGGALPQPTDVRNFARKALVWMRI